MAAATVSATSARIGDAEDMLANGLISFVNDAAAALGVAPGDAVVDAADKLAKATRPHVKPRPLMRRAMSSAPTNLALPSLDLIQYRL